MSMRIRPMMREDSRRLYSGSLARNLYAKVAGGQAEDGVPAIVNTRASTIRRGHVDTFNETTLACLLGAGRRTSQNERA